MKLTQLLIYAGIAYVGIVYIIPMIKDRGLLNFGSSGGIGGAGQAGGFGVNGAPGADANGASARISGSNATVCTGTNCQTFSGDNISVSCVNGRCSSHNAKVIHWAY